MHGVKKIKNIKNSFTEITKKISKKKKTFV